MLIATLDTATVLTKTAPNKAQNPFVTSVQRRIQALRHAPGMEGISAKERKRIIQTIAENIRMPGKKTPAEPTRQVQRYHFSEALPQGPELHIMKILYPQEELSDFLLEPKNYDRYLFVCTLITIAEQVLFLMHEDSLKLKLYMFFRQILEQTPQPDIPVTIGTADLEQLVFALGGDEAWAEFCELLTPETLFALEPEATAADGFALALHGRYLYINGGQQRDLSGKTSTDLGTLQSAKKIFSRAVFLYETKGEAAVRNYLAVFSGKQRPPQLAARELVNVSFFELLSCVYDLDPASLLLRETVFVGALCAVFENSFFIESRDALGELRLEYVASDSSVLWQAVCTERQRVLAFLHYKKTDKLYDTLCQKGLIQQELAGYVCLHPRRVQTLLQRDQSFFSGRQLRHLAFIQCDLRAGNFSLCDMRGAMILDCFFDEESLSRTQTDMTVHADLAFWTTVLRNSYSNRFFADRAHIAREVEQLVQTHRFFKEQPWRIAVVARTFDRGQAFGLFSLADITEFLQLLHPDVLGDDVFWQSLYVLMAQAPESLYARLYFPFIKRIMARVTSAEPQRQFLQWIFEGIQKKDTRVSFEKILAYSIPFIEQVADTDDRALQALTTIQRVSVQAGL